MKSKLTVDIEEALYHFAKADGLGIYGCFEATIGDAYGNQRVDFMTMTSRNVFRCYEIKISKSDFHSSAKLSFLGDYNYFVMPSKLLHSLKDDELFREYMFRGIGVISYENGRLTLVRAAKNKDITISRKIELMHSMVRSLSRFCKITYEHERASLK